MSGSASARLLVVRFGSLGDLCLLSWSLAAAARAAAHAGRPWEVVLATKAVYAPLMARVPGVTRVEALPGGRPRDLVGLARRLRPLADEAVVVDAHAVLRSRLLLALLGRRPRRRLAKDTVARLLLLGLRRRGRALERTMRQRFDALLAGLAPAGAPEPLEPPLARLAPAEAPTGATGTAAGPRLGLAPGARWAPKRWPAIHWAELLREFRRRSDAPVSIFLGPQERAWFPGSELEGAAAAAGGVEVVRERDLVDLAAGLAGCSTLVTNDSGLLHLAEAVGRPVLALFGPTVREFGYFPGLPASRVLEEPLFCRPCSRNGKRGCWRRDQACLRRIAPARVLDQLLAMPPWSAAGPGATRVAGHA